VTELRVALFTANILEDGRTISRVWAELALSGQNEGTKVDNGRDPLSVYFSDLSSFGTHPGNSKSGISTQRKACDGTADLLESWQ
jgi:hypothetical protein